MHKYLRSIPFISDLLRYLRALFKAARRPQRNSLGFYINGDGAQSKGVYEIEIANFLNSNSLHYDRIINIGANIGYWPLFLKNINFAGKIDAIEPDYFNFKQLIRNIKYNNFTEIRVHKRAISNTYKQIKLYGFGTGISSLAGWAGGFSKRQQQVECIKLDDLFENNNKTLLIIDVEGAELDVLQSGKNFLNSNTDVLVEISLVDHIPAGYKTNPNFAKTFEFMKNHNYNSFAWLSELSPINESNIQQIVNGEILPSIQMYYFEK